MPSSDPVERYESRSGTSMLKAGVGSLCEKPPIWNSENDAGCSVSHSASAAAIFIG